MRRSAYVVAPLLASAAMALMAGCHKEPEMQRCVDEKNQVVDPKLCQNIPANQTQPLATGSGATGTGGSMLFIPHMYRYYYGGLGGYALGSMVSGGGYAPITGHSYSTSPSRSGTSRGGFGRSFSSSSSSSSSHSSSGGS